MGKQGALYLALGLLLGVSVSLAAWLVSEIQRPTHFALGQTAMGEGVMTMATGQISGRGNADALYMYDQKLQKLAVILVNNNNLEVVAIRDMTWDWKIPSYSAGKQIPDPREMKKAAKDLGN
ncbi:MAG: hypothetical protein KDC38_03120 [Planctomycetes bacterium]|nr:hypothetical protein [Planctomycetota bacterium]